MKLTVPLLTQVMKDHSLGRPKGRPKGKLVQEILQKHPDIDFSLYKKQKKEKEQRPETVPLKTIEFRRHGLLVEHLSRFTHAELKNAIQSRGFTKEGRKMEVAERLAALVEHDFRQTLKTTCTAWKPPSTESKAEELTEGMDEAEMRAVLSERMGNDIISYPDYLDVQHFVDCVKLNGTLWEGPLTAATKDEQLEIMRSHREALSVENLNYIILARICREMWVKVDDSDTREAIQEKFENERQTKLETLDRESHEGVYNTLKEWLAEVSADLKCLHQFSQIDAMSDSEVLEEMREIGNHEATVEQGIEALKELRKIEIEFHPRSLALLSAQVLHRMMTLTTHELSFLLGRTPDSANAPLDNRARSIFEDAFLESAVTAFSELYDEVMQQAAAAEETVKKFRPTTALDMQPTMQKEDLDPFISIGVVFGGARSDPIETFSSVRCLLDHLQSAPYGTDPLGSTSGSSGLCLALYYVDISSEEATVYRLSPAEFLSLDVTAFEKSRNGIWNLGTPVESFEAFLGELGSLEYLISLTPSLDVAAEAAGHMSDLAELDAQFLGSSTGSHCLSQDLYGCLTYLRTRGFLIAPMYFIQKTDLSDPETWSRGFERWCHYHGLDKDTQSFYVRPANRHGRLPRRETRGMAHMMESVKTVFTQESMEHAILQPVTSEEGFIDFACTVLETETGPVALVPTEYELLPAEYVRSLSSPLRRHTPPRFSFEKIEAMRDVSVRVFEELGLSGYACIQGRLMIDAQKETELKNEELTYPRPIPDIPDPFAELELSSEVHAHMKALMTERERELDAIVESYDTSEYTPETLRYFEAQDAEDAKRGVIVNRREELDIIIDTVR